MKIVALDISKNRIGIAVSSNCRKFLVKTRKIIIKHNKKWKQELKEFYTEFDNIYKTYVGMPLNGENINIIKNICHNIRNIIQPFKFVSEHFSTQFATDIINNKESDLSLDEVSATVIMWDIISKLS